MRILQIFFCALIVVSFGACDSETRSPRVERAATVSGNGLNVLMIAVDDLNTFVSHLDTYPAARTPNLDRIAAAGTSFSSAYAPAPACNPSRVSVFTGRRPFNTGIYLNPDDPVSALRKHGVIPQHLARNGYLTMATGKLFHRIEDNDEFFATVYAAIGSERPAERLNGVAALDDNFDWGPLDLFDDDTPDFDRVNWAIEQLGMDHDAPFFLGVGLVRPHLPWTVPEQYFEQFPIADIRLPPGILENDVDDLPRGARKEGLDGDHEIIVGAGKWKEAVQAYLASIAYADAAIGKLWDALQASPYRDNTVVILWGDHGWQFGEKNRWRKFTLWSAGSQTSYVIAVPGLQSNGQVCDTPVDLMSIYPTILELLGLPTPTDIDGVSVVPLLNDCSADWSEPALTTNGPNNHAIRRDQWSYIRHANGDEELYDRDTDRWEWTNIAREDETRQLRQEFSKLLPCKTYPVLGTVGCEKEN